MVSKKIGKRKSKSAEKSVSEPKPPGNYIDAFVKRMFGQVLVFIDFLLHYADHNFVSQIDLKRIKPAPTHYIGQRGDERIVDLIFQCRLKNGNGNLMAVIVFEHQGGSLKKIPRKLLKYISSIWDAETKEGRKVLSAPYFIVLRTGKKQHRGPKPTMADSLPKGRDGKPLGKVVEIDYDVVDLPAREFDNLVGGPVLRLALGILQKMLGENEDEWPEALLPLLEIADEERRIELTKELLDFVASALAAHNRRLDEATLSRALKPIFHDKERAMIKTIFEERKAEGKAETVLAILRAKFHRVPKGTEKAIGQMTDPIALDSLAVHAAQSKTLTEFAEALK